MKPVQERQEPTTSAHAHEESGVRVIPPECRAFIAAERINFTPDPPVSGVRPRKPVRAATDKVCPKMVESHLPLVHQVVAQIFRRVPANVLRDDLLAAGIYGLVDSLRKNGGDGGDTFEWYARTRIKGAVLDELRAQDWLTRRARDAVNAAASLREDGDSEEAVLVGLDELSFNDEQEFLAVPDPDPAATYESKETMQILVRAIDKLPERERLVIYLYYFEEKRFKEIGVALGGVSEPRVSQLHSRAIGRLRSYFEAKRYRAPRRAAASVDPEPEEASFSAETWENTLQSNDSAADELDADVA